MAAPRDVTLEDLNGKWTLNKNLSSTSDPLLALQGLNWVIRKAIGVTTITLDINEYCEDGVLRIDIEQSTSSGMPGTTEKRVLDWSEQNQADHIFGKCKAQTRLIKGVRLDEKVHPDIQIQTPVADEKISAFLRGLTLEDEGEHASNGFLVEGEGVWVQLFVRNIDKGWTAEQVWGFEVIQGERHFVRRVVVANKQGKFHQARLVYDFLERKK